MNSVKLLTLIVSIAMSASVWEPVSYSICIGNISHLPAMVEPHCTCDGASNNTHGYYPYYDYDQYDYPTKYDQWERHISFMNEMSLQSDQGYNTTYTSSGVVAFYTYDDGSVQYQKPMVSQLISTPATLTSSLTAFGVTDSRSIQGVYIESTRCAVNISGSCTQLDNTGTFIVYGTSAYEKPLNSNNMRRRDKALLIPKCIAIIREERLLPAPLVVGELTSGKRSATVTSSYHERSLVVHSTNQASLLVTITGDIVITQPCLNRCEIILPANWTSTEFSVYVYEGPMLVHRAEYNYVHSILCPISNCFLCRENFDSLSCLPGPTKAFFITAIVLGSLFVVMIVFSIGWCSWQGCSMYSARPMAPAMMLCCLLCLSSACDVNMELDSAHMSCVVNGTSRTCTLVHDVLLTIPEIGSTACLYFRSPGSNAIVGEVNITLVGGVATSLSLFDYYTSQWKAVVNSAKYCPGNARCDATINCLSNVQQNSPTNGGAIKGPSTVLGGTNYCDDSCGCAGCNCFLGCAEACTYYRVAYLPEPTIWEVRSPTSPIYRPRLKICYRGDHTSPETCVEQVFSNGPQHIFSNNLTLHNLGSTFTGVSWNDKKIVCDIGHTACYLTTAAAPNFPVAHMIGEVQSNTIAGLTSPSTTSYVFASDLCEAHSSDSAMYAICPNAPATTFLAGSPEFPRYYDEVYWSVSTDGYIQGVMGTYTGLMMELQGNGDFAVETQVELVCPNLQGYEVGGVWGESDEAVLSITAYSDCLPGTCILSTEDPTIVLYSQHLDLTVDPAVTTVRFTSSKRKLAFSLKCASVEKVALIFVEGELDDPTPISPDHPGESGDSFNEWFSDLNLGGKIGLFFGLIIFAIVCVVIVALLDYGVAWYLAKKMGYNKPKMDSEDLETLDTSTDDTYPDEYTHTSPLSQSDDVGGPMERLRARMARLDMLRGL